MMTIRHKALTNLVLINICSLRQLSDARMTLVLLLKLVYLTIDSVQRTNLIKRQTNNATLLSNSLQDTLTYPPHSIGDELKATCLIKLLSSFYQTNVSLINKIR